MSTRNIDRQVTLDTTDSSANAPDPANLFNFGIGAQDWPSLIPSGAGYMNKDLRSGNPHSSGTAKGTRVCALLAKHEIVHILRSFASAFLLVQERCECCLCRVSKTQTPTCNCCLPFCRRVDTAAVDRQRRLPCAHHAGVQVRESLAPPFTGWPILQRALLYSLHPFTVLPAKGAL